MEIEEHGAFCISALSGDELWHTSQTISQVVRGRWRRLTTYTAMIGPYTAFNDAVIWSTQQETVKCGMWTY